MTGVVNECNVTHRLHLLEYDGMSQPITTVNSECVWVALPELVDLLVASLHAYFIYHSWLCGESLLLWRLCKR
jgi:hypothetical protein